MAIGGWQQNIERGVSRLTARVMKTARLHQSGPAHLEIISLIM